ncbi:PHD and RING finger domain-containing protein 1 isoform X2 [Talpa occidentalis]|uniref:PHD and RING finger domain-containing protein 1 isoform X2 n=1 Tax=Talpa occidentalis TaxID=50954 RepID=UPI0018904625|nr:PHD and RING finger domain-containing protein 1 isoform X2 [Talpa occidentalis]
MGGQGRPVHVQLRSAVAPGSWALLAGKRVLDTPHRGLFPALHRAELPCLAMDDDSLDELDRSPGPGGPPPPSPAALAGDAGGGSEDDSEDDSGSDCSAGEEEEEGSLDGRSGSEDEGDEEDEEDEAAEAPGGLDSDGAFSSDDDAESCPICLNAFRGQAVGTPETCAHHFCLDCILEWAKNATSCPVDRAIFKCVCIRARPGGPTLRTVPVERTGTPEGQEEDPTFCGTCGRSDREDRLLLCDGCDAGYHMECLRPPLQEVPVDEWFCPECAAPEGAAVADPGTPSEEELLADVVPTSSRLRPRAGRTRAIARTRQSERVRATVNRNRISTARSAQHIPRYLTSSLLDETIEAVASGLSTAVYQRPLGPRASAKRRKAGRRRKAPGRRKGPSKSPRKSRGSGARLKRRQGRVRKRRGSRTQNEATARSRLAQTLGLRRPARGACTPSLYRPAEPSLGLLRADIGAASLSLFGDPYELDPFDSGEALPASPGSLLHDKRRALSQSALRSHQPVARPVSVGLSRRSLPAAGSEPEVDEAPEPDLLGSILSSQSLLMMNGADVTIHRDGSLSAKRAAPVSCQRDLPGLPNRGRGPGVGDGLQPGGPRSGNGRSQQGAGPSPSCAPAVATGATVRPGPSAGPPRPGQTQNLSAGSRLGFPRGGTPCLMGSGPRSPSLGPAMSQVSEGSPVSPSRSTGLGQAPRTTSGRTDVPQLPQIPKIGPGGQADGAPAPGQHVELPSACISRLTGREGPTQPSHSARTEGEPSGRGPQEPSSQAGGAPTPAPRAPCRGKGIGSTFESFRINIPGNAAQAGRPSHPGFCNTFRPVDSKAPRKEAPSPLFSIRKARQLKSEMYDPFDPTGSDSSSPAGSPERLGPGLLPTEITRTISVDSPEAPAAPAVRCVTSYTVEAVFGAEPEPSGALQPRDQDVAGVARDVPAAEEGLAGSPGSAAPGPSPCPPGPWEDDDGPHHSTFFGSEERTVTCVAGPEPGPLRSAPHRLVELRSRSRSSSGSTSSSHGRRKAKRKRTAARGHRRSRSRDRASRSASPPPGGDYPGRQRPRARSRRSSSDRSSSREQAKRRRARDRSREGRRGSWGHGPGRRRSRSVSPGSPARESRSKKKRPRGRECLPPSSLDRLRRHRHPRERSRERPRERRKRRSRSPSTEHRARRPRSREKRPRLRASSERKPGRAAPAVPPTQDEPAPREPPAQPAALAGAGASPAQQEAARALPEAALDPAAPAECPPEDLDYADSVEAGRVFEDLASEALLVQLDDMSSPPSPESTDSSPERALPPNPAVPLALPPKEALLALAEGTAQQLPLAEGPQQKPWLPPEVAEATVVPSTLGARALAPLEKEEGCSQTPLLRAKALVKRVTWNLQAAGDSGLRAPLPRPQKPREEVWEMDEAGPLVAQRAPFPEPPPSGHLLPEPSFPRADPSQVHSLGLPPAPALHSSVPPCTPAGQPPVQLLLQASLPLAGCGVAPSPAPAPTILATASEPAGHATANSEDRQAAPRPAAEKTKNEEYMKKLHVQERAVEEVKLAIKPFYQRREVSKDEYKDILRKAVQKICHSKSGEINPVKVGNLVKAYVDKYRHMRRHRRVEAGEGPGAEG